MPGGVDDRNTVIGEGGMIMKGSFIYQNGISLQRMRHSAAYLRAKGRKNIKKLGLALVGCGILTCMPAHAATSNSGALPASSAAAQNSTTTPAVAPVANPRVIMLRLYVSNLVRGEKFYHDVLGTTVLQKMGDKVSILGFPGGALPGIILIQSPDEVRMNGSFVLQVADVKATLDQAAANGGVLMNTRFSQQIEGMPAQSSHFTDPDGNIVEVLQIDGKRK